MNQHKEIPIAVQRDFADALSSKCRNGLIIHFNNWEIIYQPELIAWTGCSSLKGASHLSRDALEEIAEVLHEFGFIECPYEWLRS